LGLASGKAGLIPIYWKAYIIGRISLPQDCFSIVGVVKNHSSMALGLNKLERFVENILGTLQQKKSIQNNDAQHNYKKRVTNYVGTRYYHAKCYLC
jgi:hypothetical protein